MVGVGIQDLTDAAVTQQLTGLQDVLTPAPRQAAAPPFSPSETVSAQAAAARQLRGGIGVITQTPRALGAVEGMAAGAPEAAGRMGLAPGAATEQTRGFLSRGWETGLNALDVAGSQLGRPHQFLTQTAQARAQGSQWDDAVKAGLIGATGYGLHNPRYVSFGDVLEAMGVEPGVVYKGEGKLPQWNERSAAGFIADLALDPVNWITYGANKAFGLLPKTGKHLTSSGRTALMAMEHAGVLSENSEIRAFLAARGRGDLVDALQVVAPAAKAVLANPTPAIVARHRPAIRKVFDAVSVEVAAAAKVGKLGYPDPSDPSVFRPIRHFDPLLTTAHQDTLADLVKSDPKLARAYTDPGGVHAAGRIIPGVSEATAAIPGAIGKGISAAGTGVEKLGQAVTHAGARRVGRFIERKPAQIERAVDTVGEAFSTIWRLPARFARHLQTDYYAKTGEAESILRRKSEDIFKGLTTDDAEELTRAIDGGQLPTFLDSRRDLRETVDAMHRAQEELWNAQVARGLQNPGDKVDNYVYHYYLNTNRLRQVLSERQLAQPGLGPARPPIRGARTYDPSTYQRLFDTLAEAEAAGLQPEYDVRRLFVMRQVNGWRSVIAHDFLRSTAEKFGHLVKPVTLRSGQVLAPEDVINLTARAAGETLTSPIPTADLIRQGAIDVTDPANAASVAERLVREGGTPLDALDLLPEDAQRHFLQGRFAQAATRGGERELTAVQRKYAAYRHLWPAGEARDLLGDTFGLPKLAKVDGGYSTATIDLAPGQRLRVVLPRRITRKLLEIQDSGLLTSTAGGPLRTVLAAYGRFIMNPFRKVTTAPRPAYHVRNAIGNVLLSGMDIGLGILNPALHDLSVGILRGHKGVTMKTATGEILTGDQLMSEFIRYGGANTFYKRANIMGASAAEQLADEIAVGKSGWRYLNPIHTGRTVGTAIENEARLAHFLALRRDGLSGAAAMERVLKFLFDYDRQTPMDREVFRLITPFWTFFSRNLALQTSQLVTNPRVANGYYRFFNSFQTEKNPEKVYLERDLFPQYLRNQFAISAGPGRAPQMTRWVMGLDFPLRDLNRFWNGDLASTFQNEWLNNLGPVPGLGEALYAMMGGAEAGSDLERGIDAGAPAYRALAMTRRIPALHPLADWLDVREGFDSQGRVTIKANPARVKALAVLTVIDSPLRDLSRFMEPSDSPISTWARYLTGVRFEEMNPDLERRRRIRTAYDRAGQYLTGARRELETFYTKEGVEPGRAFEQGAVVIPPIEEVQ